MLKTFPFYIFLFSCSTSALASNCTDLKSCAKVMTDLFGQTYIWDASNDGQKFSSSAEIEISKQSGEVTFTALLDQVGLARVPVGDGKTYRLVKISARKDMEAPLFEGTTDDEPSLPKTWDFVTLRYQAKTPDTARYIASRFRLHVPREGRLLAEENSGVVLVSAPAPVVRQMYKLFQGADKPLSPGLKEKLRSEKEKLGN